MAVFDDGELVGCEPVFGGRNAKFEHTHLRAANPVVCVGVLHYRARDERPMNVTVTGLQARYGRPGQSAQRVVDGVVRQVGIEAGERGRQAAVPDNLAVVGAFHPRRVSGDVRAVLDRPVERPEPLDRGSFDGRFPMHATCAFCWSGSINRVAPWMHAPAMIT